MKWFLGTYTMRFNTRHRLNGHLFAGRYKSVLVDESESEYLRVACDYVHLNPARARLIESQEPLEHYRWSSYRAYLEGPAARPAWLRTDRLLGEHGTEEDNRRGRLEFSRRLEAERLSVNEAGAGGISFRRGWRLGGSYFWPGSWIVWMGKSVNTISRRNESIRRRSRRNTSFKWD